MYSNNRHMFFTHFHVTASIDRLYQPKTLSHLGFDAPIVYLRDTLRGLKFGLITYGSTLDRSGDGEICSARLPEGFFSEFFGVRLSGNQRKKLAKQLTEAGWTPEEFIPTILEHKYLTLSYGSI